MGKGLPSDEGGRRWPSVEPSGNGVTSGGAENAEELDGVNTPCVDTLKVNFASGEDTGETHGEDGEEDKSSAAVRVKSEEGRCTL